MTITEEMEFTYKQKWAVILILIIIGYGLFAFALNEALNYSGTIESRRSSLSGTPGLVFIWTLAMIMFLTGSLGVVGIISRFVIEPKITVHGNFVSAPGPIWSPAHREHDLSTVVSIEVVSLSKNQLFEIRMSDSRLTVASSNFESADHFNQFVEVVAAARC
ncbi:hypothetical protein [Sessilibacter corallicola]|uniref:hypothetical protein n=1 Tax=Sessilibacter corallicola TaxID=2904075 RepID=UPI001E43D9FD|nr:hypothetical protein [Sessilibacter corallicola]MCE2029719.1 hypothetical protein [Sessilibacter corallicola]